MEDRQYLDACPRCEQRVVCHPRDVDYHRNEIRARYSCHRCGHWWDTSWQREAAR